MRVMAVDGNPARGAAEDQFTPQSVDAAAAWAEGFVEVQVETAGLGSGETPEGQPQDQDHQQDDIAPGESDIAGNGGAWRFSHAAFASLRRAPTPPIPAGGRHRTNGCWRRNRCG